MSKSKITILKIACCLSFGMFATVTGYSQDTKYRIGISTGSFTPEITKVDRAEATRTPLFAGKYYRLVQLHQLPSDKEKKAWEAQGLLLTDYLPGNCYYAVVNSNFDWELVRSYVRAVMVPDSRFKLEVPLYLNKERVQARGGQLKLTISFYSNLDYAQVAEHLKQQGVAIGAYRDYSHQVDVTIAASRLNDLVALPYVQFIGEQEGERINEATNYSNRNVTGRANYLNTGQSGLMFNGNGVVLAIGEGGTVDDGPDFKGRLTELETGAVSGHKVGTM